MILNHTFHGEMQSWTKCFIFGVDNSSSVHIDGRNENISVFDEVPTQGLDDTTIRAEAKYYLVLLIFIKSPL